MLVLAVNSICIGVADDNERAAKLLNNWNNQRPFQVSECQATSNEYLSGEQVLDIIYHGVPLSVWTTNLTGVIESVQITVIRSVESFL